MLGVVVAGIGFTADGSSLNGVVIRFLHITSFSLSVGMSFWVTFVAGDTLDYILESHPQCIFVSLDSLAHDMKAPVSFHLIIIDPYLM